MVPFKFQGTYKVKELRPEGDYRINETVAILLDGENNEHPVTMVQKWPVKIPIKAYGKNQGPLN
jgi:V/A-type H+-transporting ATPase subunit A